MNIGLDARTLCSPRPRGTGRNLLDAYRVLTRLRPDWHFTLFHQRPLADCPHLVGPAAPEWPANVTWRQLSAPGDRWDLWCQLRLPLAAWRAGIDCLHLPANAAPAWCTVPYVTTIHDLIPLSNDEAGSAASRRRFRRGVARALAGATHIVTPSEATRAALHRQFGLVRPPVTVIPWAPDTRIAAAAGMPPDPQARAALRARYDLHKPWLLNFAGQGQRKNAEGLLRAIALLAPTLRSQFHWVLAGCDDARRRAALGRCAGDLGIAEDCRILPFLPHEDLPDLLCGARALLIPSLHEGFGLPVLDAFACGVPVVSAHGSSLPEVAGDAALYCDPRLPVSIAAALELVLQPDVAAQLVARGRRRVQNYSWERVARSLAGVFECCRAVRPLRATYQPEGMPCR